jgi:hypothetical protein
MTAIVPFNGTERIERFDSLQSGQYWSAIADIPHELISAGDILLIESIRWADEKMHTIILRAHPRHFGERVAKPDKEGRSISHITLTNHLFLLDDFLTAFVYAPDAQKSRTADIAILQGKINQLQNDMTSTLSDPQKMREIANKTLEDKAREKASRSGESLNLPRVIDDTAMNLASSSIGTALSMGVNESQVDAMQYAVQRMSQIATVQSEWITERTKEISSVINSMNPYYAEMAAAQLATTEDVRNHVQKLLEGIKSLDLYTGKDVIVNTVSVGKSAPYDEPLTFVQRKLMVDEELAVWLDIDEWFDFKNIELFFTALRDRPALVNQIFPAQRCVVAMATTRRFIDYNDKWANAAQNAINAEVFLMVRDGQNLHQVSSPVESHLGASRLFPSTDELDEIFRGFDGEKIKYEDVRYTRGREKHDNKALHYKRLLILCAGLDHRLELFGEFYDRKEAFSFVSMGFQEKHFHFIHDEEGQGLIDNPENLIRPSLGEYIKDCNRQLRSGSRVMCNWLPLINPLTAPGAITKTPDDKYSSYHIKVNIIREKEIVIARNVGDDIVVDMAVTRYSYTKHIDKEFNVKVTLTKYREGWSESESSLPYLVLDGVNPDDLEWYIFNRGVRQNHLYYIRLFKETVKMLRAERELEIPAREALLTAMVKGNVGQAEQRNAAIDRAIVAWRAANRGAPLSQALASDDSWIELLNQMYLISGNASKQGDAINSHYEIKGYRPLRIIVTPNGKIGVYLAPKDDERDDRIESHKWVHLAVIEAKVRGGIRELSRSWVLLKAYCASETTIYEYEAAKEWAGLSSVFASYNEKQRVINYATEGAKQAVDLKSVQSFSAMVYNWAKAYDVINRKGRSGGMVRHPILCIPIGVCIIANETKYIYMGTSSPETYLYNRSHDEDQKERILQTYMSWYKNKEVAKEQFNNKNHRRLSLFISDYKPDSDSLYSTNTEFEFDSLAEDMFRMAGSFDTLNGYWKAALFQCEKNKARSYYSKRILWLSDLLTSETGEPIIDETINETFERIVPVDIVQFNIPESASPIVKSTNEKLSISTWFDMGNAGFDELLSLQDIECESYEVVRHSFSSHDEALLFLMENHHNATKETWGKAQVETPPGIERWYYN